MSNGFYRIASVDTGDGRIHVDEYWTSWSSGYEVKLLRLGGPDGMPPEGAHRAYLELTKDQVRELAAQLREWVSDPKFADQA